MGIGEEQTQKWLDTDIVACLQNFFVKCQTGNYLDDPEVNLFELFIDVINVRGLLMWFCFCSGEKSVGNIVWTAPDKRHG